MFKHIPKITIFMLTGLIAASIIMTPSVQAAQWNFLDSLRSYVPSFIANNPKSCLAAVIGVGAFAFGWFYWNKRKQQNLAGRLNNEISSFFIASPTSNVGSGNGSVNTTVPGGSGSNTSTMTDSALSSPSRDALLKETEELRNALEAIKSSIEDLKPLQHELIVERTKILLSKIGMKKPLWDFLVKCITKDGDSNIDQAIEQIRTHIIRGAALLKASLTSDAQQNLQRALEDASVLPAQRAITDLLWHIGGSELAMNGTLTLEVVQNDQALTVAISTKTRNFIKLLVEAYHKQVGSNIDLNSPLITLTLSKSYLPCNFDVIEIGDKHVTLKYKTV